MPSPRAPYRRYHGESSCGASSGPANMPVIFCANDCELLEKTVFGSISPKEVLTVCDKATLRFSGLKFWILLSAG